MLERWLDDPAEPPPTPPLRQGFLTMAEALSILRDRPDWAPRLQGDLQLHTEWSDGSNTLQEMADAARERGYSYLAITDHSKGLKIAKGMDEERLREQGREMEAIEFPLLKAIEMNLSPQGEGDMEPEALAELDLVLGAFHSKLRLKEDQTERYLKAVENPTVNVLAHPRGRIYNFRMGLTCDWERVFARAAELDKAVEVDGFPDRQDLDVNTLRLAAEAGVRVSLGTDAHAAWQLDFMPLALAAACQAGISPSRILNFMDRAELVEWAKSTRISD